MDRTKCPEVQMEWNIVSLRPSGLYEKESYPYYKDVWNVEVSVISGLTAPESLKFS